MALTRSSTPVVSIIIPCWNSGKYVGEAIESALQQDFAAKEVIVINDGSTDDSEEVISGFGNAIVPLRQNRRGANAARNLGLSRARGRLLQFLDSDDVLDSKKLAIQVPEAISTPGEIITCRWLSEEAEIGASALLETDYPSEDSVIFALMNVITTCAPLYPKSALESIGGWSERLPCAQDFDLNLRLACSEFRFRRLDRSLVRVRRRRDGVSADYVGVITQFERICWACYESLKQRGSLTDARAEAFAGFLSGRSRILRRMREDMKAKECADSAFRMHHTGGLRIAYGKATRVLHCLLGADLAEKLTSVKRRAVSFFVREQ